MRFPRRPSGHDSNEAASYVQGELAQRARVRFEEHLLGCEQCWTEVQRGRAGRALAERGRELSPPGLREDIRAAVALSGAERGRRSPILVSVAAVLALGLAAAGLVVGNRLRGPRQPRAISAALASFRLDSAPGVAPTLHAPPDLSAAGLRLLDSGRSSLGGMPVDVYRFTDGATKVVLFLSAERFPEAVGAQERGGSIHGWRASDRGDVLLCADVPVPYLLIGRDASLVARAESALREQATAPTS